MRNNLKPNAVQLHPITDAWMQGDRYAAIVARRANGELLLRLDKSQKLRWAKPREILEEFTRV
jgi:hypothetical protein